MLVNGMNIVSLSPRAFYICFLFLLKKKIFFTMILLS